MWRFSFDSLSWTANDVQGVDYSTMLFGLVSHSKVLGSEFFQYYNNFDFPTNMIDIKDNCERNMENAKEIVLNPNYPNPFNLSTTINFEIKKNGKIELTIYNMKGQVVKNIVSSKLNAGEHNYQWDGKNSDNKYVSSGVYIVFINFKDSVIERRKLLLIK